MNKATQRPSGGTGRRPRKSIESRLYDWLGSDFCGTTQPPPGDITLVTQHPHFAGFEFVFTVLNDGFELGIGHPDRWDTILHETQARKLAWFVLWRWWACGTWFGLRRRLWYRLLHRRVARIGKMRPV